MLRPNCKITITQQPTTTYPSRNKSYILNFVHSIEINSSWKNLTDTAKLVFPKNIYVIDEKGKRVSWQDKDLISGSGTPILLRGDKIQIELGYYFYDQYGKESLEMNTEFTGYISKVINRMPIEIECEDSMYLLKQISAPNKLFKQSEYNLQTMLSEMLKDTDLTVNADEKTYVGNFRPLNETVAQVLNRLRKDYKLESYFRGNELRCSGIVYLNNEGNDVNFAFQENIIEDSLEYKRLDDIKIAVKAYSVNENEIAGKKKKERISVFVTDKGEVSESGFDGEKRTLYFWNIKTKPELVKMAQERLNRIYYEGFFGSFKSFGLPFVKHGDNVVLIDRILPERSGTYKCKGIKVEYGINGFRRTIDIDIRLDDGVNKNVS